MSRVPNYKELVGALLANHYGGWMYCEGCGKTIGYLCYVTYSRVRFSFTCLCGCKGSAEIRFDTERPEVLSSIPPAIIKNRLCCAEDSSPLLTAVEKNLKEYRYEVTCAACGKTYVRE